MPGDSQIALYLASNLPRVLRAAPSYDSQPRAALSEAFLALDQELTSHEGAENIARAEALRKDARQQCAVARALDAERAKVRPLLGAAAPAEPPRRGQPDSALSPHRPRRGRGCCAMQPRAALMWQHSPLPWKRKSALRLAGRS